MSSTDPSRSENAFTVLADPDNTGSPSRGHDRKEDFDIDMNVEAGSLSTAGEYQNINFEDEPAIEGETHMEGQDDTKPAAPATASKTSVPTVDPLGNVKRLKITTRPSPPRRGTPAFRAREKRRPAPASGVPTVPTEASTLTAATVVDFMKRKRAEWAERDEAERKKVRTAEEPTKITVSEGAPLDMRATAQQASATSQTFRSVIDPQPRYCAIMVCPVDNKDDPSVLGNIFNIPEDVEVQLKVDAGRYGKPQLTLSFKIQDSESKAFTASWRPGVSQNNQFMIDQFQSYVLADVELGVHPHFGFIYGHCKESEKEGVTSRIVALDFISYAVHSTNVNEEDLSLLSEDNQKTFRRILSPAVPQHVCVWFRPKPNADTAHKEWINFLGQAINKHLPPLWQYRDDEGRVLSDFGASPRIWELGDGMYKKLSKKHGAKNPEMDTRNFHRFAFRQDWDTPDEFRVTISMPVVRDVQYALTQSQALSAVPHHAFFKRIPTFPDTKGDKALMMLGNVCHAFIRLLPTPSGSRATPPTLNTRVHLEMDNSFEVRPHVHSFKNEDQFFGTVVPNEAECNETGTHFCILLNLNRGKFPGEPLSKLRNLEDGHMHLVRLSVKIDTTAAKRELQAAENLSNPTFNPGDLKSIRTAFAGKADTSVGHQTDLMKDKTAFAGWLKHIERACNAEQLGVVKKLTNIEDKLLAVTGPPGTGKTKSLAETVGAALTQDYRCLVVGPANKSVDQAATYVFSRISSDLRKKKKLLRFEVTSSELKAMVAIKNYQNLDQQDPMTAPETQDLLGEEITTALNESLTALVRDNEDNERFLQKCFDKYKDTTEAIDQYRCRQARRVTNVATSMTSGYHCFDIIIEDKMAAQKEFDEIINIWRAPKLSDEQLSQMLSEGVIETGSEKWEALAADALSDEEIRTHLESGRIQGIEARDKSFEYREALKKYISVDGMLRGAERKRFLVLWEQMMSRVFARVDCVFATCNNAASDLITLGFNPQVLFCDEAGQVTMSSLAIILTSYKDWLAVILFGDPHQLRPCSVAGIFNEFRENSKVSSLGLLDLKKSHIIRLTVQYRMAPAIASWIADFFYDSQLTNHPKAEADNHWRKVARAVSRETYAIKGPRGRGSEFFVIDVARGVSHKQKNGTSLVNYANSEAAALLVDRLLAKSAAVGGSDSIQPSDITILTYYSGQKFVAASSLQAKATESGRTWAIDDVKLSSVDAYQGRENRIVILDMVVARLRLSGNDPISAQDHDDDSSDEDDDRRAEVSNSAIMSSHVRDPHRLCCALTRARDALVTIVQGSLVMRTFQARQSKERAAISEFFRDADERKLVYVDWDHGDRSPEGLALRASWDQARIDAELESRKLEREDVSKCCLNRPRRGIGR